MNKKVSIIIPVYNSEKYLRRCVDSLLVQSYKDIEILIIDDGSTDESKKIGREYDEKYKNIKFISKKNGGVSSTRNKGIEYANGEYIQFVDADDYVEGNYVEVMVSEMQCEDTEMVICGYKRVNTEGKILENVGIREKVNNCYEDEVFEKLYEMNLINTVWNKIYIKEKIMIKFDEGMSFGEDLIFNLNYLEGIEGRVKVLNESYYNYVVTDGSSLTATYRKDRLEIGKRLNNSAKEFCEKRIGRKYNENIIKANFVYAVEENIEMCISNSNMSVKEKLDTIKNIIVDEYIIENSRGVALEKKQCELIRKFMLKGRYKTIYALFKLKKILKKMR